MKADKIAGFLETGIAFNTEAGCYEIVVNFPATHNDKEHHVIFSVNQARNFAAMLLKKASEAEWEDPPPQEATKCPQPTDTAASATKTPPPADSASPPKSTP